MPVQHALAHPDVHAPWSQWSEEQTLHLVVPYSNPFRWRTRRELANDCIRHLRQTPNIKLYVVELAYGDRPWEITEPGVEGHIQLRTSHELFHKENLINAGVRYFTPGWKYGGYVDGDFHFTRHDWALEAIHQLQHYEFVQPYSSYADLSGRTYGMGHRPIGRNNTFAFNYIQNGYRLPEGFNSGGWKINGIPTDGDYYGAMIGAGGKRVGVGATGGAWTWRRSAFDTCGGMLDVCILGHGDWFMAFGLVGEEAPDMHIGGYAADYRNAIYAWQANARKLKRNIGYVDCFATHNFHGSKSRRGYSNRDLILVSQKFSPSAHLKRDWQGIWQLDPDSPSLRDEIRRYFISRTEDDPNLYGPEKALV
jgi:hypothetical protein